MKRPKHRNGAGAAALVLVRRARERLESGAYEAAREYFDEAVRLDPRSAEAYAGRGVAWHFAGEFRNAVADYDRAARLDPRNASLCRDRGTAKYRLGDFEGAVADYTRALRLDRTDASTWSYRADAHARLGNHAAAVQDLTEALRRRPEAPDVLFRRAKSWKQLGRLRKALDDLDRAIELDPLSDDAFELRGAIYQEMGRAEEAERDAARVRELQARAAIGGGGGAKKTLVPSLIRDHFHPEPVQNITVSTREFPFRVRADLQRCVSALFADGGRTRHFCGVHQEYAHEGMDFSSLLVQSGNNQAVSAPPEYEDVDVGDEQPVRCLRTGLWLLSDRGVKSAVLVCPAMRYGHVQGLKVQVAAPNSPDGTRVAQEIFASLEAAVMRSESYRGKVLSLEERHEYTGRSTGLMVHRLRTVRREEVILPRKTLDLLHRNVEGFARQRDALARFGLSTKKGLLFYGPPGTGKTHTIHHLIGTLEGHTTFLITAGQMGLLSEYMTLARLLQPSLVVIEDVDLIARDRESMDGPCAESLLNVLLNEMDGLKPDARIFFILTTNRPASLEAALASRPGRIDQAIEFPLPDEEGREKLVRLYAQGLMLPEDVVRDTVRRTGGVSASFIRELMRRAAQFHLEAGRTNGAISPSDVAAALDELLVAGGSLNRKLLGALDEA